LPGDIPAILGNNDASDFCRPTMNTHYRVAVPLLIAGAIAIAAPKKPAPEKGLARYGMAVYADLCLQDSGEFGGQRITLQRFAEVDTVIYEYTAGGLSWPLVASDVNIDPAGRQFYFTVQPPDEPERTLSGKFSADGAMLTLDGGYCADASLPMKLPRVRDFSQKPGACRACPAGKASKAVAGEAADGPRDVPVKEQPDLAPSLEENETPALLPNGPPAMLPNLPPNQSPNRRPVPQPGEPRITPPSDPRITPPSEQRIAPPGEQRELPAPKWEPAPPSQG
jgi:hypothetical protein